MKRPAFQPGMKPAEFEQHYWYREELAAICKKHGLQQGTKAQMEETVIAFLRGKKGTLGDASVKDKSARALESRARSKRPAKNSSGKGKQKGLASIDLKTRIIDGFKFNEHARQFFSKHLEKTDFKFTKEMAEAVREANANQNSKLRVQDLVKIYQKVQAAIKGGKKRPGTKVDHIYRWNTFVRDFNADPETKGIRDRMEVAARLWAIVRDRPGPKVYSKELLKYLNNA